MRSKRTKRTKSKTFWRSQERNSRALPRRRRIFLSGTVLFIAVIAILALAVFYQNFSLKNPWIFHKISEPSEEQIIQGISKFGLPEGVPQITKIENAAEQAKIYPVLFDGTRDGQYALRYETLFAVYDYQEDKIVRRIPIINMNIAQPLKLGN